MPVCIAGMHRSGTSMVARLLAAVGVYLGPAEELVAPAPDNPGGFWENVRFLRLNDEVLARLGGSWDRPPPLDRLRASDRRLAAMRREAAVLIERFREHEPWGWKDPRNSLTLPLWREMVRDLRPVICVRHPLEVAASLGRRPRPAATDGLTLWLTYTRCALAAAPPELRVVTHYDAYLYDAEAELRRVLEALGIPASRADIVRACALVSPPDVETRATTEDLAHAPVPPETAALYLEVCEEAGPVCRRALEEKAAARVGRSQPTTGSSRQAQVGGSTPPARSGEALPQAARRALRVWRQEGFRTLVRVAVLKARLWIMARTVARMAARTSCRAGGRPGRGGSS